MLAPRLLLVLIAQATPADNVDKNERTLGLPTPTHDPLVPRASELDADPEQSGDALGPGSLLPKVGEGLEVAVGGRFGFGTDATDAIRGDPPYGGVIDFIARLQDQTWFAAVHSAAQIAGPEANPPNGDSRQVFQPWEIGIDGGYSYRPTSGWLLEPMIGFRGQPDPIGPAEDPELALVAETYIERKWADRGHRTLAVSARVVGRYSGNDHDLASDQRLDRGTCFLWGRRFFDCALAFTLSPGTVGAEGQLATTFGRFAGAIWGGWFLAGRADEVGTPSSEALAVRQNDGDWTWVGLRLAFAAADDIDLAVEATTGGRIRDSLDSSRIPFLTSDLARTAIVLHVEARL